MLKNVYGSNLPVLFNIADFIVLLYSEIGGTGGIMIKVIPMEITGTLIVRWIVKLIGRFDWQTFLIIESISKSFQ